MAVVPVSDDEEPSTPAGRRRRVDARRNEDAVLEAAAAVFASSGVDAPVRQIAQAAGVGVGTVYRNFPQRSDLIAAVFRREVDACADEAATLAARFAPIDALERWLQRYAGFIATKQGLAAALHSGDPAYDALPAYFDQRFRPALEDLLARAGLPPDLDAGDLLRAVADLSHGAPRSERMVALLVDGLRHRLSSG
ncbi:TetR family transcriptional regulator [Motilibacter rhizosphaerae]|uniref:TetR family transcriptional regulator n=1 Tax=Motilibacter rhizosphaerae TaxID=598652 RepID=A0A4Q7NAK1_9ACTN|nr:TetR/AcrR family transcriptional regulator [Motilibacter rhizosphaerae]RZS79962.1 TetR family transcriptional regulator [Motilibacter rhizosphaerae]